MISPRALNHALRKFQAARAMMTYGTPSIGSLYVSEFQDRIVDALKF